MSVYRRGDVFWYNFWFEGQHIQRPTKVRSRVQALKMESIHKARLALGKYDLGPKKVIPTFADFSQRYLEYSKDNKRAYVVERYIIPKTLGPFYGKFRLNEITPFVIERYKHKRLKRGVKKSSINREIGLLKSMLSTSVGWEILESNPARDGKLFKLDEPSSTRVLSYAEEERLLAACNDPELQLRAPHLKAIILMAIYSGQRRSEVLGCKFEAIDLEKGILTVRKSKTKAGQGRTIPLNSLLRQLLLKRQEEISGPWVFPSPKNPAEHVGDVKNSFRRAVKIAGIPRITFHQLRHTFCSRLSDSGVPLAVIQELAGHASILVTRRYLHPAEDLKLRAVEQLLKVEKPLVPTTKSTTPRHALRKTRTADIHFAPVNTGLSSTAQNQSLTATAT